MALVRMLVSSLPSASSPATDAIDNTLYFNVSGTTPVDPPGYQTLVDDLYAIWATKAWATGRFLDIRAYDMGDDKPRPIMARKTGQVAGTTPSGARQIALALSYYADRNLPRQRGRIFLGPWTSASINASSAQTDAVMTLPPALANLGGVNVDWSLWSPTNQQATRINHAWCDDSWDVIRSRKIGPSGARKTWNGDG